MTPLLDTGLYQLVEGRHGRFLANPNDLYIGRSLLTYGEFSEAECKVLCTMVPKNGVVIEAGANVGAFTVPLARKAGLGGMVYAFEPQVSIHQLLCANIALNSLHNVQTFNAACGETEAWINISRVDPSVEGNFGGLRLDQLARPNGARVRIERLDAALDPPRLDLIKADVEGMERAVLEGARGLITQHRPMIYAEAHNPDDAPALIRLLQEMEYQLWWHLPRMFSPDNHAGVAKNLFGVITSKNILARPAERATNIVGGKPVAGESDHPAHWGAA
ncbi:MAG: FkbM family methyltransferase [Pseudomonadota bacterium]